MARPKKPTYEYVERLGRYRKRIKDADGNYVAIYGKTPEELTEKLAEAQRQIDEAVFRRDNPTVEDYATKLEDVNDLVQYITGELEEKVNLLLGTGE